MTRDRGYGCFSENKVRVLNAEMANEHLSGVQAGRRTDYRLRRKASLTSLSVLLSGETALIRARTQSENKS
jgi:hypothetical protein